MDNLEINMTVVQVITIGLSVVTFILATSATIGGFIALNKIQNNHLHHVDLDLQELKAGNKVIGEKLETLSKAVFAQKIICEERNCKNKNLKTR
jgi:hypothetical protein